MVINPNFEVAESDYTNNAMKCNCKYDGHRIWVHNCHIGIWWEEQQEDCGMGGKGLHSPCFCVFPRTSGAPSLSTSTHPPLNVSALLPKLPIHLADDAFSEEANKRFERYPGQTSNQIV